MLKMRRLLLILTFLSGALVANAQDLRSCFVDMPDSLSPLLTKINREDCLDFMDSKMRAVVTNRMEKPSEMTALEENYIALDLTSESTLQMKLLPGKGKEKVICVVSTMKTGAQDSRISFFTTSWQPLDATKYYNLEFSVSDFMKPLEQDASYQLRDAYSEADILFLKMDLDPKESRMILTCTTKDYLSKETAELLEDRFLGPVTLDWIQGKGFRRIQ